MGNGVNHIRQNVLQSSSGFPGVDVADDLVGVHVGSVGEVRLESVVLEDDGLEDVLEVLVRVGIAGVDAAVLVVEVDGACDGLEEHILGSIRDHTYMTSKKIRISCGHPPLPRFPTEKKFMQPHLLFGDPNSGRQIKMIPERLTPVSL